MAITTRAGLIDYCLRRLGSPVIEINVDDDQVSDRIDDALQFWSEYHFDGTERIYLKAQVAASTLTFAEAVADGYIHNELILGQTSGATARVYQILDGNTIMQLSHTVGTFADSEIVTGASSGFSGVLTSSEAFVIGNWDLGYFETTDAITGVVRIFPVGTGNSGGSVNNIFDVVYQFRLTDMYDLLSSDLTYYAQMKQHLETLDMILPGQRTVRFNRKQNRVHIDVDWYTVFSPGMYIVAECFAIINPADFSKVYDDMFLKRYSTALIKRQWSENLIKFVGIQLPGGVTLNGDKLYEQAIGEIESLENEMQNRFELPPIFMVG